MIPDWSTDMEYDLPWSFCDGVDVPLRRKESAGEKEAD
jgi:hypothetical protein